MKGVKKHKKGCKKGCKQLLLFFNNNNNKSTIMSMLN